MDMSRLDRIAEWTPLALEACYNAKRMAVLCGVSQRQLERFWKSAHGQTPQAWLDELRMRKAQELLAAGFTVKETAFSLGFKQSSHFCRKFKIQTGVTPHQFIVTSSLQTMPAVAIG